MNNKIFLIFVLFFSIILSCTNTEKYNITNTFYINYICKNDSLLNILKSATSGKAAYFDNEKKLQVVSLNYVTEEHPKTHYLKVSEELPVKPELNTIKYEISFNESMLNDSIAYSLKKFIYSKEGWQNKSEMGIIKVFDNLSERDRNLPVIKNNVARLVLITIAADTYSK
ncbi:MAG: hypothetical protein ABI741_00290 [Ferruginibacter sp.]